MESVDQALKDRPSSRDGDGEDATTTTAHPVSLGGGGMSTAEALHSHSVEEDCAAAGRASSIVVEEGDPPRPSHPIVPDSSDPLVEEKEENNDPPTAAADDLEDPHDPPLLMDDDDENNNNNNDNHHTVGSSPPRHHHHHHHGPNNQASSVQSHSVVLDDDQDLNLDMTSPSSNVSAVPHHDTSSFVPGPLREEPTLKEKLVDRERQRRKEAERARLKRQFALMSNGGGLVYETLHNNNNAAAGPSSTTGGAAGVIGSVTGTVGEESTHAGDYLEDSNSMMMPFSHSHNNNHHPGDQQSPQQLGYTMERFLQERDAATANNSTRITTSITEVAAVAAAAAAGSSSTDDSISNNNDNMNSINVIREETIDGGPTTAGAPDKGVVMERFLNDPVVVDAAPPAPAESLQEEEEQDPHIRPEDVHRSVSFDMELRTALYNDTAAAAENNEDQQPTYNNALPNNLNLSIDDSNTSVRVEVAPEDDDTRTEPVSPGGQLSSVLDHHHHRQRHHHHHRHNLGTEASLGSVGPSMDGHRSVASSSNANNDINDDSTTRSAGDEPRFFRLTEAEIQEMAAIEEASIGNAPPSDRAESLVGDLVGDFVDPTGTTFSQGTPTTEAMESGSIFSGNQMSTTQRSSNALPGDRRHHRDEQQAHHDNDGENLDDDIDHQHRSIDDMAMSASDASHLVVSPGGSVSGSAASVAANPPSEINGRGGPTAALLLGEVDNHDDEMTSPLPPPPVVVGGLSGIRRRSSSPPSVVIADANNEDNANMETDVATSSREREDRREHNAPSLLPQTSPASRPECLNSASIREELEATLGPPAEAIVNRRMRPGMVNLAQGEGSALLSSPLRRIVSLPARINSGSSIGDTPKCSQTVDEFDFDKHDLPMTPRSLMSDSIRDLPGDDLWTSPAAGIKMSLSPVHRQKGQRDPKIDPLLMVPVMSKNRTASKERAFSALDRNSTSPSVVLSKWDCVFRDVQMSHDSAVVAKDSELYCRGTILTKALQTRLLPLILACVIELSALRMIAGGSDRLCFLLGRQHQQLLIGFIPLIAAISGEISTQASALTTRAVSHGHLTSRNFQNWMLAESKVAGLIGLGMGATLAALAFSFSFTSGKNMAFALAVGIVQFISAAFAGFTGSIAPLVLCFLFKKNSRHLAGPIERAVPDVIATFLTTGVSYLFLSILVSPVNNPTDGCSA